MSSSCEICGTTDSSRLTLVFNGEIYNFRELRRQLANSGHQFRSASDSEVLLHLYAERGLQFLGELNGIFALAIYDNRDRGRPTDVRRGDVLVARDGIGVKPLYFSVSPTGVLFASEMKALLRWDGLSRVLDAPAIRQTLTYLWTPAPRTVLASVRKLEPGQALLLRGGRVERQWYFYDVPTGEPTLRGSMQDVAQQVRQCLQEAVERQMVADVPVGAFLSGGVDSSAVVAAARRAGHVLQCYCIGFGGRISGSEGMADDAPYARRVAAHLGVPLEVLEMNADVMGHLERVLYYLDEPQADPAALNTLLICERARVDGFKVMLGGTGGDDIFSGYRRHRALWYDGFWDGIPMVVRRALAGAARAPWNVGQHRTPAIRRLQKLLMSVDHPADERMIRYMWWNEERARDRLLSPDMLARAREEDPAAPLLRTLGRLPAGEHRMTRMLYLETKHFLADHNLNYTDRMGMAAGVEVRVPLLDLKMVALAGRIPPQYKQRGNVGKAVLKKALESDLPRDIVHRSKTGFAAPLRHWLRTELRDLVESSLSPASLEAHGIFDAMAVRELIDADRAGRIDGSYTIFSVLCLELWCRMFIDSAGAPPARMEAALGAGA
ncbi:asparagine synthase (glutamine-hydrolyzing) [soil metagenome]